MSYLEAIVLGIVQGLCEFLPVSSSGHLLLMQKLFNINEGGLLFTVLLHLGTLAAVLIVYRKRIVEMICHPIKQGKYWVWMILATAVTVLMQLLLGDIFESANDGRFLGYSFLLTALLLTICDIVRKRYDMALTIRDMKWYQSAFIGFMQGVAILPGVSRSGATIAGASFCKMNKEEAAEFSFLLSIPAILGGAVLEVPGALKEGLTDNLFPMLLGVVVAGIAGYFAVRFMIKLITKHSFRGFVIYTAVLGLYVILDWNVFHLIFK